MLRVNEGIFLNSLFLTNSRYTMKLPLRIFGGLAAALAWTFPAWAASPAVDPLILTGTWIGLSALVLFAVAYSSVINEEFLGLRKSKPVIVAAGFGRSATLKTFAGPLIAGLIRLLELSICRKLDRLQAR